MRPMATGRCVKCDNPTELLDRFVGMFGLTEVYCSYCPECLPEEYRQTHDNLVASVKAANESKRGQHNQTRSTEGPAKGKAPGR